MTQSAKRVLVSGVSGQDGSYMADYLLANTPHTVYGMVRRTAKPDYGNLTAAMANPRFQLVVGDLSDSASIDALVRQIKPDYFINLAAQSFVASSWAIPEMTFDVDAIGVVRCLEAIRKHVPHCRFYSAGSSEQWGDVAYSPQDEKHPLRPRSPYGAAKCAAAHIVKVYRESYGLYALHGILFNHESERRGPEFVTRKVTLGVARIVKAIREGKTFEPIELGNLDAKRDWSHAEDFVDGIWRMLNQEDCRRDIVVTPGPMTREEAIAQGCTVDNVRSWLGEYVLSSDETHTVRSFVEKAFAAAGIKGEWDLPHHRGTVNERFWYDNGEKAAPLVRINPAFYRPAEVDLLLGDSRRARAELGWQPKVSFEQLVERMVRSDCAALGISL